MFVRRFGGLPSPSNLLSKTAMRASMPSTFLSTWSIRVFVLPMSALISTSWQPNFSNSSLFASWYILRPIIIPICAMVTASFAIVAHPLSFSVKLCLKT